MAEQQNIPDSTSKTPAPQLVQPMVSPPGDHLQPSPTQVENVPVGPLSIHSSSRTPSEAAPEPAVYQLPPLVAQRNAVHSLQAIPQPARFMFLDRGRSAQQIPNMGQTLRLGVLGQRQTSQNSLVAFRQESLRGSRVVHVPSNQELPEVNRPLNSAHAGSIPAPAGNRAIIIPIEHIEEEEHRNEAADDNRQGDQAIQIPTEGAQGEEEVQEQDPNERRVSRVAKLRVALQFIFNIAMLLIYGFAYLFVEGKIGVTAVFIIAICFVAVYLLGLLIKKKFSTREFDKADFLLALGNGLSIIVYAVIAYIIYEGVDIPLTPFSLFGVLVLLGSCCKSSLEPPQPTTVLILIVKVIAWVQLFLVALRIDTLSIPWSTIFIPLYFGLLLLAFSSILIIFGSTYAFINIMKSEGVSAKLILGSIWYILNALYTGAWLAILTQVARHLDSDAQDLNDNYIQTGLTIALIHGGVLFFYTLFLWKILCKFQEFEVQSEMLVGASAENAQVQSQDPIPPRTQVRFQVSKDDKTHLVMISPSFYTYLKKHLKHKNDKDIQNLKNELEKVKRERNANALALRAPHYTDVPAHMAPIASPPRMGLRNREFSEGAVQTRQQAPAPALALTLAPLPAQGQAVETTPAAPPRMKRGESTRTGENLCTICYDSVPNGVYMDCGHGGVCYECALETWKKSDFCILCRRKISKVLKIVNIKPLNVTKVVECTRKVVEPA